ncbi:MAG: deoxyribodipyrimidine photo-lyase [Thermoleophilaceae bacterium]|nr:deoxyribodipyrimidine photo-lyase [Thermoleophilaceae bacterium]
MPALVWFTRDLRVHDNPALRAALQESESVVPVFCLDDRILHGRHSSGPRTQFMLECLADLDESLRERGGALVIRRGRPEDELPRLAAEVGADAVHFTRDVTPFSRRRRVEGLALRPHPGLTVVDDVADIKPYVVFSPFHRTWEREPRREVLGAPRKVELPPGLDPGSIPTLEELGLEQEVDHPAKGGETEARRRLKGFAATQTQETSRLSPYLHFGCISPREAEERIPDARFRRQLAWRDFFHQVLLNHPSNAHHEFQERYRGTIDWERDDEALDAWKEGRTGFPFVDAGMRQLRREGWMPNRVRLVVASFLTKQLGIDWREGERHFMRYLIDGDEANNNGNWQWIASVGVDPAPYFRRLYNPARHAERYDPDGAYVHRYVPELRDAPGDYPAPIVDQREGRERAIERYRVAAGRAARGTRAETSRL